MKSAGNRIEALSPALFLGDNVLLSVDIFHRIVEPIVEIREGSL